jgi:hypothetical protein
VNTSAKKLKVIETSNQRLGHRCVNPNTETQDVWKKKRKQSKVTPPKVNICTIMYPNNSDVVEISKNSKA